ncbi:MAG: hypothetical protein LH471_05040 [Salinibacterium sp.]|nr:hypothetical protein [Salinibacterium sp.]
MNPRASGGTKPMSSSDIVARATQAHSFLEAARLAVDSAAALGDEAVANVAASNAVYAGIAAADAICGKALAVRSTSFNHADAVALVRRAHEGEAAANHLRALISLRNNAAYEPRMVTAAKAADAIQHAERLVAAMDKMLR